MSWIVKTDELKSIRLRCPVENEVVGEYVTNAPSDVIKEVIDEMREKQERDEIDFTCEEFETIMSRLGWMIRSIDFEDFEF